MLTRKIEFLVGLFLVAGIGAFLILVFNVANISISNDNDTYSLSAHFNNVGGLKVRSPVKVGGVVVGRVSDIELDPKLLEAVVTMKIDKKYHEFPQSSSLAIQTSGLLGEQYLALTPGFALDADTPMLQNGDKIEDTHSALVLEDLIGQLLYSFGNKKEK